MIHAVQGTGQSLRQAHLQIDPPNGRDAKDVSFATIFRPARLLAMDPDSVLLNRDPAM